MSKQRIRRKGTDGKDVILDVDLGPGKAAASGNALASSVGHMQPILKDSSHRLKSSGAGAGWAVYRRLTITSKNQQSGPPGHEPRQNNSRGELAEGS